MTAVNRLNAALLASFIVASPTTARAQASTPSPLPSGMCAQVVDAHGTPLSARVAWILRTTNGERQKLDAHCHAVGPIVVRPSPTTPRARGAGDDIAIIGWNVHVGGGDVARLVERMETGALTGSPIRHYVLLLQEVYRSGGGIGPAPDRLRVPRRIAPRPRTHARDDIVAIARRLDLSLYYVPSMRNGRGAPFEDRGNAILSTLPLDGFEAIELPMARQRRVAIVARIRGAEGEVPASALQVGVVHLDALAGLSRLWIFATGWRGRQADAVIASVEPHVPSVLAGDLNTWFLGRAEPAYRRFARAFPETSSTTAPAGERTRGRLDALFYRLLPPAASQTWTPRDPCGTKDARCGSDHRPVVGVTTVRLQ